MKLCLALLIFGKSLLHLTEFVHLYNKTRNSYIYMLPIAGPNGLTFLWTLRGSQKVFKAKKLNKKKIQNFFSADNARALQLVFIIRQDIIKIYVAYSRPNGWTKWADIFCGHSRVAGGRGGGCLRLKLFLFSLFSI